MSIFVLSWVFKHSEAKLSDRLVLLALADYAEDDGTKAFPAIETLAAKARVSERTAQGSLRKLEQGGAIKATGRTQGGITVYRVLMSEEAAQLRGVQDSRGAGFGSEGVQNAASRGADSRDAHIKEPSKGTVSSNRGRREAPTREEAPLSHLLADLIAANDPDGSRPNVGKTWADAERRLQEIDKRSPAQIEVVVRWVQADEFERSVVLSMPKLRQRYRQLLSKATKEVPQRGGKAATRTDSDILMLAEAQKRLREEGR